ncbi:MAG: ABC transporter ATP-binding protein [Halioglobus sp.]
MSFDNDAIRVNRLWKVYDIYTSPGDRFLSFLGLKRGASCERFEAISDLSFRVGKGEVVGIVGRNGSGKSTLLQLIAGVLKPTRGEIALQGRISAILELGAGFNPEATGRENIYINGAILGYSATAIEAKMDSIIEFADIGNFIDRPVKLYSSGMYVRLAFAIAISVEPDILIVDEALSVGDAAFQRKCFGRIESLRQMGTTILFVSHSEALVIELCDRAILLEAGKQVCAGKPKMVMGLYNRLINANEASLPQTLAEIEQHVREQCSEDTNKDNSVVTATQQTTNTAVDDSFLDPHLVSKSIVSYESKGAKILNPRILNANGEHVNVLVRGQHYLYAYEVHFEQPLQGVRFSFLIKSISGLEIGGAVSHTAGTGVDHITAGTKLLVSFCFDCTLNSNLYFMNAGVQAKIGDAQDYAHRVLDLYMFRVQPIENDTATAVVDLRTDDFFTLEHLS